jgi:hypothetical protein
MGPWLVIGQLDGERSKVKGKGLRAEEPKTGKTWGQIFILNFGTRDDRVEGIASPIRF